MATPSSLCCAILLFLFSLPFMTPTPFCSHDFGCRVVDAVLRTMLYEKGEEKVDPYDIMVFEFTNMISRLRNELDKCGVKDEGLIVPLKHSAESQTTSNVLLADPDLLSYSRTPKEIMRIMYGTGDEHRPGGFFPKGANGRIAREYLNNNKLRGL